MDDAREVIDLALAKSKVIVLENKGYVLAFGGRNFTMADVARLQKALSMFNVKNVVVVLTHGEPDEVMSVTEQEQTND
jgi:hypothetical protein